MAQVRIKNLTQHRIYIPVPVGIMMGPAQEITLSEISDDALAKSKKISTLVERKVIQVAIQTQDPEIDDSLETRLISTGGGLPLHGSTHHAGGVDAIDVVSLRGTGGAAGDVLVADGVGGLLFQAAGAPGIHATTHQHGGTDEVATATPAPNAIPKAGPAGILAGGWIPYGTTATTAARGNDTRIPTQDENNALAGTFGTPSGANRFVTDTDSRMTNPRVPTSHASTHQAGGSDPLGTVTPTANAIPQAGGTGLLAGGWIPYGTIANTATQGNDTRIPTQNENDALLGTSGSPSSANRFVTNLDSRLTDARTPTSHAASHADGGSDTIDVATLGSASAPTSGYLPTSDGVGGLVWQTAGTPALHAATHKDGGADEVATSTPGPDEIVKALSSGKIATGWINVGTSAGQIAAGDDSRIPSQTENDALQGTFGVPSGTNRFVTDTDSRMTNARTPTAHASSHHAGGADEIDAANLASDSAPATGYVLASAASGTCVWTTPSAPGAHASTHYAGGADEIDVSLLASDSAPASGYIPTSDGLGGLTWQTSSTPGPHAATHQDGGVDEIATATAAANAIPKANASGTFNAGWVDDTSHGSRGGGSLHSLATTGSAGFMSAADKTTHDILTAYYDDRATEPQGFVNRTDSVLSVVNGTRTVSIAPTGVSFDFWAASVRYTKSTAQSVVIPDVDGVYYVYFDDSGTLTSTTTFTDELFTRYAYVAVVYWSVTQAQFIILIDQRNGLVMDGATCRTLSRAFGSQWISGLGLSNITADGDGNTNAAAQFAVDDGVFYHHDQSISVSDDNPQDLATTAAIPIYYYAGTGQWHVKPADNFPLIYSGTAGYAGTLLPYNEFSGGTWNLTEAASGQFVVTHYYACASTATPVVGICGRQAHATISEALSSVIASAREVLTDFAIKEFVYLGSVIFETNNAFLNTPKARVRAPTATTDYVDGRSYTPQSVPSHVATHQNGGSDELNVAGLSGLLADPQTPTTHAASHQHGGADEVATATPSANAIPKAGAGGTLDAGWIPLVAPSAHASTHQHGGADEVATATPSANAIPKAGAGGALDGGWVTYGSIASTAVEGNDTRIPTQDENNALQGTAGSPSNTNRFVTNDDGRLTDARTPTAHASTHQHLGSDEIATATPSANAIPKAGAGGTLAGGWIPYGTTASTATQGNDTRIPSQTENDALQGTAGTPSNTNRFVTDVDTRMTNARTPTGAASGQLGGTYPSPDVRGLRETGGPTLLTIGNIGDGEFLARSGTQIIGSIPAGVGDVAGPAGATDNAIVRFDSTTGKIIQDSLVTIDDTGNVSVPALATVDGRDVSVDGSTLDSHVGSTANPHSTSIANIGSGTLAQLNSAVSDATLDDASATRDPNSHAASHQHGGSDEIATATPAANAIPKAGAGGTLDAGWIPPVTPASHVTSHESGGADEISVAGLSGVLADPQTPATHASTHQHGGTDEVATATPAANAIPKAGAAGTLAPGWTALAQTIKVAGSGADFTSIKSAVDSITDASSSKPYVVRVYPGVYTEAPFTIPAYVTVRGSGSSNSQIIQTSDNNANFITCTPAGELEDCTIIGPTGTGFASLYMITGSANEVFYVRRVYLGGSYYGASVTSSGSPARFVLSEVLWLPLANVEEIVRVRGNAQVTALSSRFSNQTFSAQKCVSVADTATYNASSVRHEGAVDGIWANGAVEVNLGSCLIRYNTNGIHVTSTVGPAQVHANAIILDNVTYDVLVDASDAIVQIAGTGHKDKFLINAGARFSGSVLDHTVDEEGLVVFGELFADQLPLVQHGTDTYGTGYSTGGVITRTTGLGVQVTAGSGYVNDGTVVKRVTWSTGPLTLPADTDFVYIYVDDTGTIQHATTIDLAQHILLGFAHTNATDVVVLTSHRVKIAQGRKTFHDYVEDVIGPITVSGLTTTEHSSPSLQLAVDQGTYYVSDDRQVVSATAPITFTYWYVASGGGWNTVASQTALDPDNYDDSSGTLQSVTAGKYTRQLLFITNGGDGTEYHVVYGQQLFDTDTDAVNGNNPNAPEILTSGGLRLAAIVLLQGATSTTSIVDERPFLGQLAAGTTAVSIHALLSGLAADDHPQYQLRSEKGIANGYAPLDTNSEVPAANLNLSTTTPAVTTASLGVIGTSEELARADHKHNVSTAAPVTIGTANAAGIATSLALSDHVHAHGAQTDETLHALATPTTAGFLSAADKGKIDRTADGDVTLEPTGFENRTDTTIAFDSVTRTFTIAPTGADFSFYRHGTKYTKTTENIVVPDVSGLWFIYYDATATLVVSPTFWSLAQHVPVAVVYWNSTLGLGVLGEERHGMTMSWATHLYLHRTEGTRYINGLDISGFVLDTDSDTAVQFGISGGTISDEDISITITASATPSDIFEQILDDPAELPVWYRDGVTGVWTWDPATTFPFKNTPAGRVNYNQFTTTWAQAEMTNGAYVAYWVIATNILAEPVVVLQGQREDLTLNDSRRFSRIADLSLGDFPFAESRLLWRVIVQTDDSFGGTRKAKIVSVEDFRGHNGALTEQFVDDSVSGLAGLLTDAQTPLNHASTHQHGGSDEIATATPAANAIPKADGSGSLDAWVTHLTLTSSSPTDVTKSAAVVGVATDAARADHKHDVSTAAPAQGIGGGNTEGTATSLARSDHNHAIRETGGPTNLTIGTIADGQIVRRSGTTLIGTADQDHFVAVSGADTTPGTLTDKLVDGAGITTTILTPGGDEDLSIAVDFATTAPTNVTKAAAVIGVADEAARADHKHDVTTGVASALSANSINSEGTAVSLARSDHTHAIDVTTGVVSEVNAGDTAQPGTGTGLARRDHQHGVATGATVGLSAVTTNTEGVGTNLARADHTHAIDVTNGAISTVNAGDGAAEGTGSGVARRDHQHAVATAAPSQGIGAGNSEGVSVSLARSDHDHTLRETGGPTELTIGSIADGDVLLRSGTSVVGTTLGTGLTFGQDYQTAADMTRTTTTAATPQTKVSLVTPALTGTYRIAWTAVIDISVKSVLFSAELYNVTDAAIIGTTQTHITSASSLPILGVGGFSEVIMTGASKTFSIRFFTSGGTVGIQSARIEFWRII